MMQKMEANQTGIMLSISMHPSTDIFERLSGPRGQHPQIAVSEKPHEIRTILRLRGRPVFVFRRRIKILLVKEAQAAFVVLSLRESCADSSFVR